MAMKRCPVCGEKYSDTYRDCPFCEEEEALREGEAIRRMPRKGRRAAHGRSRSYSLITPTLIVLILIMAGLLIYLLYGDKLAAKFRKDETPDNPPVEEVIPSVPVEPVDPEPVEPDDPAQTEDPQGGEIGVMPEDPGTTTEPEPVTPAEPVDQEYEKAMSLPAGLSLSTEDFSLMTLGETHTIRVSGGSGSYKWISQDPGVVSVDQSGKVTAVSGGTVNVVVTDGSKKAVCIVRVRASGTLAPSTNPSTGSESSSGLKAGDAKVINGGNGVRVRSGPGTNYDILATVPNGANIRVVESAGNDWYKISFDDVGGVSKTGYMKGEFLVNK